jgi:hypothetical protein
VKEALQQSDGGASISTGLSAKVNKDLKRLGEIEGGVTGESFYMSNQTFCSKSKAADWLLLGKVPSCSFFWDLVSVMVSMKPKKCLGKERSDKRYSARRTNSTTLENDFGAAMTHVCPKVLYSKKGYRDIERLESGFAACESYAIWVMGTKCYKDQLTKMLNNFCDGVLGTVLPNSSYENLFNTLLISVCTQWHNMCTFIHLFNKEKA